MNNNKDKYNNYFSLKYLKLIVDYLLSQGKFGFRH